MKLVAQGRLPLCMGSPHPCVAILEQDGVFRIRQLVVDKAEARKAGEEAIAAGRGWMPENYYALGKPTGEVYAEAPTRDALLAKMRTMEWPGHW